MADKLKNYLGWVVLVSVLVLVGTAWRYVSVYSRSIQPSSFRSFAVSGEGKTVVVPDIATFSFSVITEGGLDIGKLQTDNTAKINKAIDFLKGDGVATKDIKTANYNLSPRYENSNCGAVFGGPTRVCPPPSIVGYTINQTVSVKIRQANFAKIGDALTGVVKQGANNVSQLEFTLDDPASAESAARAEAIIQAKAKALSVAKAAGFSLGQLLSIEEGTVYPQAYGLGGAKFGLSADAMSAPAPTIEPGSQEVRINVTLRYEID